MIARSDLFILVVSASLLAAGIVRWQQNMSNITLASTATQPIQNSPEVNATPTQPIIAATANTVADSNTLTRSATQTGGVEPQFGQTAANTTPDSSGVQSAPQGSIDPVASTTGTTNQPNEPLYGVYIVQSGDFLGRIATNYGTSVSTLREINNISGSLIEIGQEIKYPLPAN